LTLRAFIEEIYCHCLSTALFFLIFFRNYNQTTLHAIVTITS